MSFDQCVVIEYQRSLRNISEYYKDVLNSFRRFQKIQGALQGVKGVSRVSRYSTGVCRMLQEVFKNFMEGVIEGFVEF